MRTGLPGRCILLRGAKSVLAVFHDLKETFSAINLVIADKKCEIFSLSSLTAVEGFEGIPVSCEGALFRGSPIGSMSFVTSSCGTIAQSKLSLCDQLTKLDDVQSTLLLLRYCTSIWPGQSILICLFMLLQ